MIDQELAFEAAVSIALRNGSISHAGEASQQLSRFTETSYVLMGPGNTAIQRLARPQIVAELERLARINCNLEQYQLRFRPGRATAMVGVLASLTALVSFQGWSNMINDRRIASLEQSYLEHQSTVLNGQPTSELAAVESVNEFEARVLKTKFDGCYEDAKANLARAAEGLNVAVQQKVSDGNPGNSNLTLANGAYADFKATRDHCRSFLSGLLGWRSTTSS